MCTAICSVARDCYFGRNLDLEYNYKEEVTVTPRNYAFYLSNGKVMDSHYAMVGIAYVQDGYPLYYDAVNEKGVAAAGLSFSGYACYNTPKQGSDNVASYELIPWILGRCKDMAQVKDMIQKINITDTAFSIELPPSPLHWMISYKGDSIVVEQTKSGLNIYDNPIGVLTNNPGLPYHLFSLNNYMGISPAPLQNTFGYDSLTAYSKGMGAIGLPGDNSSNSRFVRAAFTKVNSRWGEDERDNVGQFFHMLDSVSQVDGCTKVDDSKYEITVYSCCCNCDRGIYYYTTYQNRQITAVDMYRENLDGSCIVSYPICTQQQIKYVN